MKLSRKSHCKINLLLNVVGQRADGFHELEMLMLPVPIFDRLDFELLGHGIELTCNQPGIPTDSSNLVCQAAESFAAKAGVTGGVRVHLEKSIPAEGGLGGGSSNAAATLLALNKLHDQPLGQATLHELAAELGSDVPFFMQSQRPWPRAAAKLSSRLRLSRHSTASRCCSSGPASVSQRPGLTKAWPSFPGRKTARLARRTSWPSAWPTARWLRPATFYNSLEAPVFDKFPLLKLIKQHALANGAEAALMCGSGSTVFAICPDAATAQSLGQAIEAEFGKQSLAQTVSLPGDFPTVSA